MPSLTDVIGHFSVWEKSLYTCSNGEVSKCATVIQQGNRNLVKLFRYLKVRVIIIQKQMIHYISLCVFIIAGHLNAMVDWKICFSVTISNLGLKLSKLPMPSPLYLTFSTCSCVTLKTYKDSKSRIMTTIRSFLRSRCLTLQPI